MLCAQPESGAPERLPQPRITYIIYASMFWRRQTFRASKWPHMIALQVNQAAGLAKHQHEWMNSPFFVERDAEATVSVRVMRGCLKRLLKGSRVGMGG